MQGVGGWLDCNLQVVAGLELLEIWIAMGFWNVMGFGTAGNLDCHGFILDCHAFWKLLAIRIAMGFSIAMGLKTAGNPDCHMYISHCHSSRNYRHSRLP